METTDGTKDDVAKRLLHALDNGVGSRTSRIFIIFLLPFVSTVAGYAVKVTLDKFDIQQQYIMQRQDEILSLIRTDDVRINALENNVTRIQEHETATDQRITKLEGRR